MLDNSRDVIVKREGQGVYRVGVGNYTSYIAVLRIAASLNAQDSDYTHLRNICDALSRRCRRGFRYFIITTITQSGCSTCIVILSDSKELLEREVDIVESLVESLSSGVITISKSNLGILKPKLIVIPIDNPKGDKSVVQLHKIEVERPYIPKPILKRDFSGEIYLGKVISDNLQDLNLRIEHVFRHIGIFGSTGSGKTTTACTIAYRSHAIGLTVLVLDWHGEYYELLRKAQCTRLLYLDPYTALFHVKELSMKDLIDNPLELLEVFEQVLELTPSQTYILEQVLEKCRRLAVSNSNNWISTLIDLVSGYVPESRWGIESRDALLRKLRYLALTRSIVNSSRSVDSISDYSLIILDLNRVENLRLRTFCALMILKIIERRALDQELHDMLIVIDEAHNILPSKKVEGTGVARRLLAEMRKWRIGFTIVTQSPSSVAQDVLKNTNTKIVHAIKSNVDRRIISETLILRKELEDLIPCLGVGEAVVSLPDAPEPVVVKIDPRPIVNAEMEFEY